MTDILKSCAIKRIEEKDNGSNGIYVCFIYLRESLREEGMMFCLVYVVLRVSSPDLDLLLDLILMTGISSSPTRIRVTSSGVSVTAVIISRTWSSSSSAFLDSRFVCIDQIFQTYIYSLISR